MSAAIEQDSRDRWWVTCAEHSWRWEAKGGESHANNLAAKHDREWEHDDATTAGDVVEQVAELLDGDLDLAEAIVTLVRKTHAPIPF